MNSLNSKERVSSQSFFIRAIRRICVIRDPSSSSIRVPNSERGAVLVVVLGILALLTLIAVSFVYATRMSLRASEAYMRTVAASDIAEAGLANAIAILKADKIKRTGDPLDPTAAVSETYDSLRDSWRQEFSAPVVIEYTEPPTDETGLTAGDIITNVISSPEPSPPPPPYPDRYLATAEVISVDTANNRIYLNSISTAPWQVNDRLVERAGAFDVTISSVSKPDEVYLDGDGTPDAVWRNYYDESGALLGRYAVLVQDESGKINVNVAGNQSNEGWSGFEVNLDNGLETTSGPNIISYRYGLTAGATPPASGTLGYCVTLPGQGDGDWTSADSSDFDDDDDNLNRVFFANDGVDNDGDGSIDESGEGLNEPEEFRPLRPYRSNPPLDYNLANDDNDTFTDETNEADDQPILTLEQLADSQGVNLGNSFLTTKIDSDGDLSADTERRHFMSTNSFDRNLNREGEQRINLNILSPMQSATAVYSAFPPLDLYNRTNFANLQKAVNIYDYRDRNNVRAEITDTAGDTFSGVEAVRINEIMVAPRLGPYEGEALISAWWLPGVGGLAGSPRSAPAFLTRPDQSATSQNPSAGNWDQSGVLNFTLPNPPFGAATYNFKLVIRLRSTGVPNTPADRGFFVQVDGVFVTSANLGANANDNLVFGVPAGQNARWGANIANVNNWYVEQVVLPINNATSPHTIQLFKPAATVDTTGSSGMTDEVLDTVDIDWFFFSQEPDCEWIELVNIGKSPVVVDGWKLESSSIRDADLTGFAKYYNDNIYLTLPDPTSGDDVIIEPIGSASGTRYAVFVIDTDDTTTPSDNMPPFPSSPLDTMVSAATAGNTISYNTTWGGSTNVFQLSTISNIYANTSPPGDFIPDIDFFADEPLNDPNNDVSDVDARQTPTNPLDNVILNVEAGIVTLRTPEGLVADRVTYTIPDIQGFRSLQREHPANPGERLDSNDNFKLRAYTALGFSTDLNVPADGNYDDWQFAWGTNQWATPTEANNRSGTSGSDYSDPLRRVAKAVGQGKNAFFSSVGELSFVPSFEAFTAEIQYADVDDPNVGDIITNTTKTPNEVATVLSVNKTDKYMVVQGDKANVVSRWYVGDAIGNGGAFSDTIVFSKAVDRILGDQKDYDVLIKYSGGSGDLAKDDTITNTSWSPNQTATVIAVRTATNEMIVRGDPGDANKQVPQWRKGDSINNGGTFINGSIFSISGTAADTRVLADYFTTALIDLEAAAASPDRDGATGGYTKESWPGSTAPQIYRLNGSSASDLSYPNKVYADFQLQWDEDDGVAEGTYDIYSFVNYGNSLQSEESLYLGPVAITKGALGQVLLNLELANTGEAAAQYRFMRAVLAPPSQTFGRINANTASHKVLQGLPGIDSTLAAAVINARNMEPFESIGDVYRVSESDPGFTPFVFENISNLITTRSDIYKIIVLGQAATDANKNGIVEDNEITSEKKIEITYQR